MIISFFVIITFLLKINDYFLIVFLDKVLFYIFLFYSKNFYYNVRK